MEQAKTVRKCKKLLGTSVTFTGIQDVIAAFYGGERKVLKPMGDANSTTEWLIHQATSDNQIANVRVVKQGPRFRFEHYTA